MGLQSYAGRGIWYLGVHRQNQSYDEQLRIEWNRKQSSQAHISTYKRVNRAHVGLYRI